MRKPLLAILCMVMSVAARAQKTDVPDMDTVGDRGLSYITAFQGSHDSSVGWSTTMTSTVHYDFSKRWSAQFALPVYFLHNGTNPSTVVRPHTTPPLDTTYNALGDGTLDIAFAMPDSRFKYAATLSGTAPTGSRDTGISTGRPTFDLNNHFEHDLWSFTPALELGVGDSSALVNRKVRRPYTSLGPLVHFKAIASHDLFKGWDFEAGAYENLPIGSQTVYSHVLRRNRTGGIIRRGRDGKLHHFQSTPVAVGNGISEDNGFTTTLSGQLSKRVGLSFSYDRSLRQSLDTVSMEISYRLGHMKPEPK